MKKLVYGRPGPGPRPQRDDGLRNEKVRAHERRRSERQGRHLVEVGGGEPGADEGQRNADQRSRSARHCGGHGGRPESCSGRPRADAAYTAAEAVNTRADAIEKASHRLVYEVVLSEDKGNFKFGKATMPDEAKAEIDTLVQKLKAEPNGAYIEIEGHTDSAARRTATTSLGLERAENVKRYLYEQHQVPLHRINVISYGEDKPIAPNKTRDGRAQNRRVVIKVLT